MRPSAGTSEAVLWPEAGFAGREPNQRRLERGAIPRGKASAFPRLSAVALLELLAGAAPARVVPADLLLVGDAARHRADGSASAADGRHRGSGHSRTGRGACRCDRLR